MTTRYIEKSSGSLRVRVAARICTILLTIPAALLAQESTIQGNVIQDSKAAEGTIPESYELGKTASPEAIARIDIDVMPDGHGLPPGNGTASEGQVIYAAKCSQCHGAEGRDGPNGSLAGAPLFTLTELADDRSLTRTVGNYWPYATTLFDYVRRAMPFDKPGSLTSDELYAVTAYVLHVNGLLDESSTLDAESLPLINMPARERFKSANQAEVQP